MASIYRRGRIWWISYYVGGRHRCQSLKTDSQKVAEAFRKKYDYELATNTLKIQNRVDLESLVTEYLKDVEARCAPGTYETTKIFFKWFREKSRFTLLNQLSPATVQDYFRQLQLDGRAPTTVNRVIVRAECTTHVRVRCARQTPECYRATQSRFQPVAAALAEERAKRARGGGGGCQC